MDGPVPDSANIQSPLVAKIAGFLESIGLAVRFADIPDPTFLPGITVQNGILTIDEPKLLFPGDLIHEAGHLAMLPPSQRAHADGHMGDDGGIEMAAIAWSYAAAIHLGFPPAFVFHDAGYKGGAQSLLDNFAAGRYVGVPMLEWARLTASEKNAKALGVQPYPSMLRWLREE